MRSCANTCCVCSLTGSLVVLYGQKPVTTREARATARVLLGRQAYDAVSSSRGVGAGKGDVLPVAQLAGIMGAKHTSALIPLCHNISLSKVDVTCQLDETHHAVNITSTARCVVQSDRQAIR